MSHKQLSVFLAVLSLASLSLSAATPVGAEFTYQGRLQQSNSPVSGMCDFQFSLWDESAAGALIGTTNEIPSISVSNGLFTVTLDFGAAAFNGDGRWLEIAVRTTGSLADFTSLTPRQKLTATPYALQAATALQVPVANLTGVLSDGQLPANVARTNADQTFVGYNFFNNAAGYFSGDGAGLTNLNMTNLVGQLADAQLSTNVALLNASQTFSGTNWFAGPSIFDGVSVLTNGSNQVAGSFQGLFVGDGAGLTQLQATNLTGVLSDAQLPPNLARINWDQVFSGTNFFNNAIGLFSGDGAGLTNLNMTNVVGPLSDAQLSTNVALLNASQTFSGSNWFDGVSVLTNENNQLAGSFRGVFVGDGAGLTQLRATNLTGVLNDAQLPPNLARINWGQVFSGTNFFNNAIGQFSGDGAGLTNLNMTNLVGHLADGQLSTNVALLNASQTFTGTNRFTGSSLFDGVSVLTNGNNQFAGSFRGGFVGDGSGLTNLTIPSGSGTNQSMPWTPIFGGPQTALPNNGYLAANVAEVTIDLPASPVLGDVVRVAGQGKGGWRLRQGATNQVILTRPLGCAGGLDWTSNGPVKAWAAIVCSSDGVRIIAAEKSDTIYTSADSGNTWTTPNPILKTMDSIACSADGMKILAASSQGGQVYTSTDFGASWTPHGTSGQIWTGVASSEDGARLVVTARGGYVYTSSDSGTTWAPHGSVLSWKCVASSADGVKLVAALDYGQIYTSINFGVNWAAHGPIASWVAVASSADGKRLVAADRGTGGSGGQIYTSVDSGFTWTPHGTVRPWTAVATTTDGLRLFAVEATDASTGGQVYTSVDAGINWGAHGPHLPWRAIATSSDGVKVVAATAWIPDAGEPPPPPTPGAIYSSGTTTTVGLEGGLIGTEDEAVELLYMGNGQFRALSHEGKINAF